MTYRTKIQDGQIVVPAASGDWPVWPKATRST